MNDNISLALAAVGNGLQFFLSILASMCANIITDNFKLQGKLKILLFVIGLSAAFAVSMLVMITISKSPMKDDLRNLWKFGIYISLIVLVGISLVLSRHVQKEQYYYFFSIIVVLLMVLVMLAIPNSLIWVAPIIALVVLFVCAKEVVLPVVTLYRRSG